MYKLIKQVSISCTYKSIGWLNDEQTNINLIVAFCLFYWSDLGFRSSIVTSWDVWPTLRRGVGHVNTTQGWWILLASLNPCLIRSEIAEMCPNMNILFENRKVLCGSVILLKHRIWSFLCSAPPSWHECALHNKLFAHFNFEKIKANVKSRGNI